MNPFKSFFVKNRTRTLELVNIAAPLIMEQVFITLMGMINIMMASHLGRHVISAVGMIDSISNLIIALFAALTTGGTIVIAQCFGRNDRAEAEETAAQALILGFVFSMLLLLFLNVFKDQLISALYGDAEPQVIEAAGIYMQIINFSYPILAVMQTALGVLRGSGDTRTPMFITIMMNVVSAALGYTLIFGLHIGSLSTPAFGIKGAAVALLLARAVGLVTVLWYLIKKSKRLRLNRLAYFKFNFGIQKVILGLGVPSSVESSLFQLGKLITQVYIVGMGTAAIAANSIGSSIFTMINVPGNAFTIAVMILVGNRIGRGDYDDVKPTSLFALKVGMAFMSVLCLITLFLTEVIIRAYNADAETAEYFKQILYSGVIATSLIWAAAFIIPSALRATGDVRYTMFISIFSMWVFRIVIGYVLGVLLGFGLLGVWVAMYVDWLVRSICFMRRLLSGKWQKKKQK